MNFYDEILRVKDELIHDLQGLLRIPSVLTEYNQDSITPFGEEIHRAFMYMLDLGKRDGFRVKNVDNYAGHLEVGEGEEILGILCHLDVVPAGTNWRFDPFGATLHDGKIYGRGALDDKGPTMAAYYAVKVLKELGIPINKRVRIILGLDEESGWRSVKRYFEKEAMPNLGFAPDANFPLIYGEKGILTTCFSGQADGKGLYEFRFGERTNVVPDYAEAVVDSKHKEHYLAYLKDREERGDIQDLPDGKIKLIAYGKSAHAMEPDDGVNAGFILAEFLHSLFDHPFIRFLVERITFDSRAKKLGLAYHTEDMGDLTVNAGICEYKDGMFKLLLNFRYPIGFDVEAMDRAMKKLGEDYGLHHAIMGNSTPHYVDPRSEWIQILHQAYIKYTNDTNTPLLTIGGGTYARILKNGVAFGAMMPGRPDVVHQPNEYIDIEDLLKAAAIYAEAIYQLTR
ncbi:MAG TPA: dipeptidase PepV [Haloplasmataceae bacterium]